MTAYYNEIDPKAAAWLRELISRGLIAPGDVDERSIVDLRPSDLRGYAQCHFFAGIGVWSYALRKAGWPDDRPVWTGSCPCQPFSAAGKGNGFDDERHLWPFWHHLIRECAPPVVFGEQVASKDGLAWLDLVQSDMEGTGHAFGAVDFCAAGVGAPHIRQRLWFVAERLADADDARLEGRRRAEERADQRLAGSSGVDGGVADAEMWGQSGGLRERRSTERAKGPLRGHGTVGGLADAPAGGRREERADAGGLTVGDRAQGLPAGLSAGRGDSGVADADRIGTECKSGDAPEAPGFSQAERRPEHDTHVSQRGGADHARRGDLRGDGLSGHTPRPGPTNGLWRDADWLFCRDGKWRPVEPGTFPLAHGAPARVGRLRGYGNAINAEAAAAFIEAYLTP